MGKERLVNDIQHPQIRREAVKNGISMSLNSMYRVRKEEETVLRGLHVSAGYRIDGQIRPRRVLEPSRIFQRGEEFSTSGAHVFHSSRHENHSARRCHGKCRTR